MSIDRLLEGNRANICTSDDSFVARATKAGLMCRLPGADIGDICAATGIEIVNDTTTEQSGEDVIVVGTLVFRDLRI